ncbi:hypothetical protein KI387_029555, partial [Taxus chinensis]
AGPRVITEENWGVNYRALNDLFQISEQRKNVFTYDVAVQMIEIYNEQVRDLRVSHDENMIPVASTSIVIELMNLGHKNRAVGATTLNDRSCCSH